MGKTSVLIVEDQPVFSDILCQKLAVYDEIQVLAVVTNGQEALEYLSSHPSDIVFMDTRLPVMDGYEATRHITYSFPSSYVITTLLHEDLFTQVRMLDAGASGYILKSANPEMIVKAITQIQRDGIYYDMLTLAAYAQFTHQYYTKHASTLAPLSKEELQIISLLLEGFTPGEISIIYTQSYIDYYKDFLQKFEVSQTIALIHKVFRNNWLDTSSIKNRTYLHYY